MKIRTIRPAIIFGDKLIQFTPVPDSDIYYEGEVSDDLGMHLLKIRRTPIEYVRITDAPPLETSVYATSQDASKGAEESEGAPTIEPETKLAKNKKAK